MEFSWQYVQTVRSLLAEVSDTWISRNSANWELEHPYQKWFSFTKHNIGDEIEVPISLANLVSYALYQRDRDKIIVPILSSSNTYSCGGAETMLKRLSRESIQSGLIEVTSPKGELYYGCCGLILDRDLNPLLLSTYKGIVKENSIEFNQAIVHLHPDIFIHEEIPMYKSIARKMVPYLLQHSPNDLRATTYRYYSTIFNGRKYKVSIDDMAGAISTPNSPKNPINLSKDMNEFLRSHIKDVLTQIKDDYQASI